MTTKESGAGNVTFQHAPDGFRLETDNTSYLIGNDDLSLLKRGYTIPLRDLDKKSLGPSGVVYTNHGNITIRLPSMETLTLPARLMNASDDKRRVILIPSSSGMVTS